MPLGMAEEGTMAAHTSRQSSTVTPLDISSLVQRHSRNTSPTALPASGGHASTGVAPGPRQPSTIIQVPSSIAQPHLSESSAQSTLTSLHGRRESSHSASPWPLDAPHGTSCASAEQAALPSPAPSEGRRLPARRKDSFVIDPANDAELQNGLAPKRPVEDATDRDTRLKRHHAQASSAINSFHSAPLLSLILTSLLRAPRRGRPLGWILDWIRKEDKDGSRQSPGWQWHVQELLPASSLFCYVDGRWALSDSLLPSSQQVAQSDTSGQTSARKQIDEYITFITTILSQTPRRALAIEALLQHLAPTIESSNALRDLTGWRTDCVAILQSCPQFCLRSMKSPTGVIVSEWILVEDMPPPSQCRPVIAAQSQQHQEHNPQPPMPRSTTPLGSPGQPGTPHLQATSDGERPSTVAGPIMHIPNSAGSSRPLRPHPPKMPPGLETWKRSLDQFASAHSSASEIARQRLLLLKEAVQLEDVTYLLTHQISCLVTLKRQREVPHTVNLSPLVPLAELLDDNLKVEDAVLQFFASFPAPLEQFLQKQPELAQQELGAKWARFAQLFTERYEQLKASCCRRGYMPLVRELVELVSVTSPTLQKVVFTGIMRDIWGVDVSEHTRWAQHLFQINQLAFRGGRDTSQASDAYYVQNFVFARQKHWEMFPGAGRVPVSLTAGPANQARPGIVEANVGNAPGGASVSQVQPALTLNPAAGQPTSISQPSPRPITIMPARQLPTPRSRPGEPSRSIQAGSTRHNAARRPIKTHQQKLLPPANLILPQPAAPNTTRIALHLAHLRDAIPISDADATRTITPQESLFRYVSGFALGPVQLDRGKPLNRWTFEVRQADFECIPQRERLDLGRPDCQRFTASSKTYRLRGSAIKDAEQVPESEWVVAENKYPDFLWLFLNGVHLEPRRKLHHGRDLPVDLSPLIRAGENELEAFINLPSDDRRPAFPYALAVEVVVGRTHAAIVTECQTTRSAAPDQILAAIKQQLARPDRTDSTASTSSSSDDDMAIISSNLVINLFDPLAGGSMCALPVRGAHCRHRDCFDLDTFLQSRPRLDPRWPTEVDVWRCPLCRADVRPSSLLVDGFVRAAIEQLRGEGTAARAIVVEADGRWAVQAPSSLKEAGGSSRECRRRGRGRQSSASRSAVAAVVENGVREVIELSDDE